jgi:hypothetical protein
MRKLFGPPMPQRPNTPVKTNTNTTMESRNEEVANESVESAINHVPQLSILKQRKGVSEMEFLQREGYSSTMCDLFPPPSGSTDHCNNTSANGSNSRPRSPRSVNPSALPTFTINPSLSAKSTNTPVSPRTRAKNKSLRELKEMSFSLSHSESGLELDGESSSSNTNTTSDPEK